jgi:single-strand DNA-binding protein
VTFTLAVNRPYKKDEKQEADFINCVAWRNQADFMANYVKKGALLGIEGRIQVRNYKDQSDRTVYVTEVICDSVQILEQKKDAQKQEAKEDYFKPTVSVQSDDLPF